ncbi:MAG: DUF438 domain-containing protein [Patescibacteria group bacterium]|nr:DUF438 domain-containing protein [Patescibacteria group bacterium]
MNQEKIKQLTKLLKKLNSGSITTEFKYEAKEFLTGLKPAELSLAEQELIQAGLKPDDLRRLCDAHLEMLKDGLGQNMHLPEGHMIDTLQKEHEAILSFLDKLEAVNQKIQEMNDYNNKNKEWAELKHITEHLIDAEPHHQREEQILFSEIERRGVFGPPQVMLQEHEDLRKHKHELERLGQETETFDFDDLKKRLDASAKFLIFNLRDHIFRENNILYPTALEVISEPETWQAMKERADKIGYCCFTPKK